MFVFGLLVISKAAADLIFFLTSDTGSRLVTLLPFHASIFKNTHLSLMHVREMIRLQCGLKWDEMAIQSASRKY